MVQLATFSAACERNKGPILDVIHPYLSGSKSALEIGSGTGQHALYFAQHLPNLRWQTSDLVEHLPTLSTTIKTAAISNVPSPLELDVLSSLWLDNLWLDNLWLDNLWLDKSLCFDLVYSANTLHIMPWQAVEAFFSGLNSTLNEAGHLIIYGPFKYAGAFTSQSNQQFDNLLRQRGIGSAIRDFERVDKLANNAGLTLISDTAMPANNQCLIWQKNR